MQRCRDVDRQIDRWVIISMMVMCNDIGIAIIENDRRRLGLPSAPVDMDTYSSNHKYSPYIRTMCL